MQNIRSKCRQGFSGKVSAIDASSWRPGTEKQYNHVIDKWNVYCRERQINETEITMPIILEFLASQLDRGLGLSNVGTYRSPLSNYLPQIDGVPIGEHKLMTKFKGVRNLK